MEDPNAQTTDLTVEPRQTIASQPVLARTRSLLPSLQASDARVANVILEEPDAVIYRSVSEVAAAAETSSATVVRCAQKLGFRGFHDLKLALARERATFQAIQSETREDAVDERLAILAQVTSAGAQTVRDAAALVDPQAFDATVSALAAARRILFAGVGTSAPLAQDAAYRFSAIGLRAEAYADAHVQHFQSLTLEACDVCVTISHTGSTRETLEVAEAARSRGACSVAITSFASSPLTELADQVIVAGTREVAFQLEAMASRLAHLALLDALLVAVATRDQDRAQAALLHFTDMLGIHRP